MQYAGISANNKRGFVNREEPGQRWLSSAMSSTRRLPTVDVAHKESTYTEETS
jgi:hypothetical protein